MKIAEFLFFFFFAGSPFPFLGTWLPFGFHVE